MIHCHRKVMHEACTLFMEVDANSMHQAVSRERVDDDPVLIFLSSWATPKVGHAAEKRDAAPPTVNLGQAMRMPPSTYKPCVGFRGSGLRRVEGFAFRNIALVLETILLHARDSIARDIFVGQPTLNPRP